MEQEFFAAVHRDNPDEVRRLVEGRGANPNMRSTDGDGTTALHFAARYGGFELVQYLVEEARCDVEMKTLSGQGVLHEVCEHYGGLDVVRYLVETGGADIEARGRHYRTPLHCASIWGYAAIVEYLVEERQANVHSKDELGRTPLDNTIFFHVQGTGSADVVRFLLPRTFSVSEEALRRSWEPCFGKEHLDLRLLMLEKYAIRRLAFDFIRLPIHTLISQFPLPSTWAFQECIKLFPASLLSSLDDQGRLPIHVALVSTNQLEQSLSNLWIRTCSAPIVSFLFEQEPRSALTRDPTTGLYPHETAASLVPSGWLDVIYKMFRSNPHQLLQSRRRVIGSAVRTLLVSSSDESHVVVDEGPVPKRAKIHGNESSYSEM